MMPMPAIWAGERFIVIKGVRFLTEACKIARTAFNAAG